MMNENLIRLAIRSILMEAVSIPKELTGKLNGTPVFSFGPKAKEFLKGSGYFSETTRHPVYKDGKTVYMNDIELIAFKLNNMTLDRYNMYDAYFKKFSDDGKSVAGREKLTANLLKAMAIEETGIGQEVGNKRSTAEGILQVLVDTMTTLNKRRKASDKPQYTESDRINPIKSIEMAAAMIKDHMLAPPKIRKTDKLNLGGNSQTIDDMLSTYKTGPDGPFYAKRVHVYEKFIDMLGGL
jgi:hypothetical protein